MKGIVFLAGSLDDLRLWPDDAKRAAGFELHKVQQGSSPRDWKPMPVVGAGVRELRLHVDGEFRVFYVAVFAEAVYVIHCFQKKTQRTSWHHVELAARRFRSLAAQRQLWGHD